MRPSRRWAIGCGSTISASSPGSPTRLTAATGLTRLDRLASAAARALGDRGRPLFVPRDESLAWIWLPLGGNDGSSRRTLLSKAFDNGDSVGAHGRRGAGLRRSTGSGRPIARPHAPRTWRLPPGRAGRLTTFADVGAVALICADIDAARTWIWGTLGDLALDDEPHARLRDTLRIYLVTGSYTGTAERMALHKNSVQYRIRKAEEALGAPDRGPPRRPGTGPARVSVPRRHGPAAGRRLNPLRGIADQVVNPGRASGRTRARHAIRRRRADR